MDGPFIAVDWGTTNRRAWRVDADGVATASPVEGTGVLGISPGGFPAEIAAIRAALGDLPVLAAGMVGSNRGWREVPYVDAPAGADAVAAGCLMAGDDVTLVPGVALRRPDRCDVMRGEEVQALGAVAAGLAPSDALLCQPGTHNKWIEVAGGRIVDVATAMTGELFALLRGHGVLAGMLDGPVADGPAFRRGLARGAGAVDLSVALFGVRAAVLLGELPPADAAAYASGLLIGADVGTRGDLHGQEVHLLAAGTLAGLYAAAIGASGGRVVAVDSGAAFLAGMGEIRRRL